MARKPWSDNDPRWAQLLSVDCTYTEGCGAKVGQRCVHTTRVTYNPSGPPEYHEIGSPILNGVHWGRNIRAQGSRKEQRED